jgi:hypothetical protein
VLRTRWLQPYTPRRASRCGARRRATGSAWPLWPHVSCLSAGRFTSTDAIYSGQTVVSAAVGVLPCAALALSPTPCLSSLLYGGCSHARWRYPAIGDWRHAQVVRRQSCAGFSWRKSDDITQYQVRGFLFGYLVPSQLPTAAADCRVFLTTATAGSLLFFAGPIKCHHRISYVIWGVLISRLLRGGKRDSAMCDSSTSSSCLRVFAIHSVVSQWNDVLKQPGSPTPWHREALSLGRYRRLPSSVLSASSSRMDRLNSMVSGFGCGHSLNIPCAAQNTGFESLGWS